MLGGGGCVPDFLGLVEPIAALIPQPLQPGVSALLGSGVNGLAGAVIRTVGSAVLGEAGGAMAAKLAQGSEAVELVEEVRQGLDAVAGRGQQAVQAAIEDIGAIAMEALAEIGATVNPLQLLGPTAPVALAEAQAIACKRLARSCWGWRRRPRPPWCLRRPSRQSPRRPRGRTGRLPRRRTRVGPRDPGRLPAGRL